MNGFLQRSTTALPNELEQEKTVHDGGAEKRHMLYTNFKPHGRKLDEIDKTPGVFRKISGRNLRGHSSK